MVRRLRIGALVLGLCLVIAFLGFAATEARAATLTGLIVFSTAADGSAAGGQIWNTLGGDFIFNLYLSPMLPPPGLLTPIINPGNSPTTSISIPLVPGIFEFTMFGQPGVAVPFNAINVFFDGNNATPGISAFAPLDEAPSPPFPPFSANASPTTLALNGSITPGAGTLTFTDGVVDVTLTVFSWSHPSVFTTDRVQAFNSVPGGGNDFIGRLVLVVTPAQAVPEPATVFLTAFGLLGVASTSRRRLKRRALG